MKTRFSKLVALFSVGGFLCLLPAPSSFAQIGDNVPVNNEFGNSQAVTIEGYSGSAEEPFLTPDGQYLIFDSRTDVEKDSNIYYAKKVTDSHFIFMGEVKGVNTPSFEGVVSLDDDNNF